MSDLNSVPVVDVMGNLVSNEAPSLEDALEQQEVEASGDQELGAEEEIQAKVEENKGEDNPFDSKFAALSRKEKAFREEQDSFRAEQEKARAEQQETMNALKEQIAQLTELKKEPEAEPLKPLDYRLKRDPLNTLKEQGLDFDTLTDIALNDGKLSTEMQMQLMKEELESSYKAKFEEMEQKLQEKEELQKQTAEERQLETERIAVENFKGKISTHVDASDSLDLIKEFKAQDRVYEVIDEHFTETGNVLSIEEAADAVEKYLFGEVERLAKNDKIRKRLFGEAAEPVIGKKNSGVTLSNTQSSTIPSESGRPLSHQESLKSAASMLKWND